MTGSIVYYERAQELCKEIQESLVIVELGFLALAQRLDEFEANKYYEVMGYKTFKGWVDDPDIEINYRLAHDLIRIQREIVQRLVDQGMPLTEAQEMLVRAGISKVRALLPVVNDENFVQLLEEAPNISWSDLRERVKAIGSGIDEPPPPLPMYLTEKRKTRSGYVVDVKCRGVEEYIFIGALSFMFETLADDFIKRLT